MNAYSFAEPQEQAATLELRPKVLMIDDDVDQTEVIAYRLANQGFETKTSVLGELGLRIAQEWQPHVILLDIRLPDVNGLDLCSQLVDGEQTSHIPVILVSGAEIGHVVRRARAAGSAYYLRKPYDPNVLLALVQQALDR